MQNHITIMMEKVPRKTYKNKESLPSGRGLPLSTILEYTRKTTPRRLVRFDRVQQLVSSSPPNLDKKKEAYTFFNKGS